MLRDALARDGRTVTQINIKRNNTTGKSRGFAFVDMGSIDEANAAIAALQGGSLDGRTIKVNHAKELPAPRGFEYPTSGSGFRDNKRGSRR